MNPHYPVNYCPQGMTGSPGSPGPDGKAGPAVSTEPQMNMLYEGN